MSFSMKASGKDRTTEEEIAYDNKQDEKPKHFRTRKDNPYLVDYQINNIEEYVDENTVNVIDADTLAFQVASAVEEDYVEVKHIGSGKSIECSNATEWKGRLKSGIDPKSKLGNINLKREAQGKEPFKLEDYEIIPRKRLKHEKGAEIDGIKFPNSFEVMKYYLDEWIEAIKVQTTVDKVMLVIGEGKVHRHELPLPKPYKDGRDQERPILLKEARKYMQEAYNTKVAPEGYEADEVVDTWGKKGYVAYKKTGKFSYIKSSPDKDASNKEGLWFNYSKDFNFKIPQPFLIPSDVDDVGQITIDGSYIRGVGLKHLCYQLLQGDVADTFSPRKYLPDEYKKVKKVQYGVTKFFEDFYGLYEPKEVLQKTVDKFVEWFPEGVSYTDCHGNEANFDTLGYMELMFSCAYMKEGKKDKTVFKDLLDKFEVDYSKAANNSVGELEVTSDTEVVGKVMSELKTSLSDIQELASIKAGTKPVLMERFEEIYKALGEAQDKLNEVYE